MAVDPANAQELADIAGEIGADVHPDGPRFSLVTQSALCAIATKELLRQGWGMIT